jgi:hypothetical protein
MIHFGQNNVCYIKTTMNAEMFKLGITKVITDFAENE